MFKLCYQESTKSFWLTGANGCQGTSEAQCWVCLNIFLVHRDKLAEGTGPDDSRMSYCDAKFTDIEKNAALSVGTNETGVPRHEKLKEFLIMEEIKY